MAEKTGATVKKIHDFNTSGVLEVCIKGNWYRVTSQDFRSFDGKRRYSKPTRQPGLGMKDMHEIEFITVDYTDELFNILTQIKNTFLEREKMIFELNKKIDQEKKELEANISKKIDSLRGNAQSKKKQKTEIEEKIEEVDQLKNIDDIMTIYNK